LQEYGYPNIYFSKKSTHEYVDPLMAGHSGIIPGFTTSQKTRPLVIAKMEEFVRNKLIKVKSKRLFNEMKTFVWHNGRPQAMKKHNDDLIMACAIGCWVKDTAYSINQRDLDYQKAFLSSVGTSNRSLNTSIPGMLSYEKIKRENNLEERKQEYADFTWLLKG